MPLPDIKNVHVSVLLSVFPIILRCNFSGVRFDVNNHLFLSFQDDVFSPQGQQSYTLDPHRKVSLVLAELWRGYYLYMIQYRSPQQQQQQQHYICFLGAFDEWSDGPFWSSSDDPGADGPPPLQRAAHWLPDAQSLSSAAGTPTYATRRTARGEGWCLCEVNLRSTECVKKLIRSWCCSVLAWLKFD